METRLEAGLSVEGGKVDIEELEQDIDREDVTLLDDGGNAVCFRLHLLPIVDGDRCPPFCDTTGGQLWGAAVVLARKLLTEPETVRGLIVLELGARCGVVSMAAAYAKASRVVCTDGDEFTCASIHRNFDRNKSLWFHRGEPLQETLMEVEALRYEDAAARAQAGGGGFEVVLGSDLVYGDHGEMLACAADALLGPNGKLILCCPTDRWGLRELEVALKRRGFLVRRTSTHASGIGVLEEVDPLSDDEGDDPLWLSQHLQLGYFLYICMKTGELGVASTGSSL